MFDRQHSYQVLLLYVHKRVLHLVELEGEGNDEKQQLKHHRNHRGDRQEVVIASYRRSHLCCGAPKHVPLRLFQLLPVDRGAARRSRMHCCIERKRDNGQASLLQPRRTADS